jgi:hypothetical protein
MRRLVRVEVGVGVGIIEIMGILVELGNGFARVSLVKDGADTARSQRQGADISWSSASFGAGKMRLVERRWWVGWRRRLRRRHFWFLCGLYRHGRTTFQKCRAEGDQRDDVRSQRVGCVVC